MLKKILFLLVTASFAVSPLALADDAAQVSANQAVQAANVNADMKAKVEARHDNKQARHQEMKAKHKAMRERRMDERKARHDKRMDERKARHEKRMDERKARQEEHKQNMQEKRAN